MPSPPKAKIDTMPKMRAGPARVKRVFSEACPTGSCCGTSPRSPHRNSASMATEIIEASMAGENARNQGGGGGGAGQAAKTPHAMEGRHVGAARIPFDIAGMCIHGHIHAAARGAKQKNDNGEGDDVRRQRNENAKAAQQSGSDAQQMDDTDAMDQPCTARHGKNTAAAEHEQDQAERKRLQPQPFLEGGYLRSPDPEKDTVGQEHGGRRVPYAPAPMCADDGIRQNVLLPIWARLPRCRSGWRPAAGQRLQARSRPDSPA